MVQICRRSRRGRCRCEDAGDGRRASDGAPGWRIGRAFRSVLSREPVHGKLGLYRRRGAIRGEIYGIHTKTFQVSLDSFRAFALLATFSRRSSTTFNPPQVNVSVEWMNTEEEKSCRDSVRDDCLPVCMVSVASASLCRPCWWFQAASTPDEQHEVLIRIVDQYLMPTSPDEVNISGDMSKRIACFRTRYRVFTLPRVLRTYV